MRRNSYIAKQFYTPTELEDYLNGLEQDTTAFHEVVAITETTENFTLVYKRLPCIS